jgi:hypothetical protein
MMPNTIQPREYSRGSGIGGVLHITDDDPNLLNVNRNDDGRWLNTTYDSPDNRWNRENGFAFIVSQLSSFLPLVFLGGVLFGELSAPAAEHFAYLV